jgi:CCR4-NOT complex subunit CAF16
MATIGNYKANDFTNYDPEKPIVTIKNLDFSYDVGKPNIKGLDCVIPPNSKVILVGANGAGKSTLLRILCGGIFMNLEHDEFDINGNQRPNDQANGVAYLGGVWKRRRTGFEGVCPYTMDIAARDMMAKWQEENKERRDELVRVMGINLDWRMHECSDGQRKKVRIMIKLLRPFKLCVIDEFAADLDIFSRKRLFDYFTDQCSRHGAAVVYATHIFDQADMWASHIAFMQLDKVLSPVHKLKDYAPYQEVLARSGAERAMCPMYVLVHEELERQYRAHSKFFTDRQQCITDIDISDVIMEEQRTETAGDAHIVRAESDATAWLDGRLARELALKDMDDEKRKEWMAKKEARDTAMAAIKAVVEDGGRSEDEKVKRLREMEATGEFNPIAGSHQSHLVLTEALAKFKTSL